MDMQDRVKEEMDKLNSETTDEILMNFNQFKQYLAGKVKIGESLGLSEEKLAKTTEIVADYLAKHETPRNREENILMALWNSGTKEEQHTLAHMLLKMIKEA